MGFFSEAKGGGGLPSPSISSKRRRDGSSSSGRSSRSASLKLAALLVLVSAGSFLLGSSTSSTSSTAKTAPNSPVPHHGPSGSPEQFALTVVTLSIRPRVFFLPGFADPELASALADATEPKLQPSTLALRPGEKAEDKAGIRTSDGVFVTAAEDPSGFLAAVERKAEALTGLPRSHGEAFNILRYRSKGRYETHYDSFDDGEYGPQASQRVATLIVYLKTPPPGSGGETCFPLAEAEGEELARGVVDFRACSGLRVPPTRPGDALLFYNLHPNGTRDKRSMHGAEEGAFSDGRGEEKEGLGMSRLSHHLSLSLSLSPSQISIRQKKQVAARSLRDPSGSRPSGSGTRRFEKGRRRRKGWKEKERVKGNGATSYYSFFSLRFARGKTKQQL